MQIIRLETAFKPATVVGLVLAATSNGSGFAASFDCTKAKTDVERTICDDAQLSKLDDEMAKVYRLARKRASDKQSFHMSQLTWLQKRDSCSGSGMDACLIDSYERRLAVLRGPHAGVYIRGARYKYKVLDDQAFDPVKPAETVCDKFLDLLERADHPMLACGVGPISAGPFSRPTWKPVDAWGQRGWIFQIQLDWFQRNQEPFPEDRRADFQRNWEKLIRDETYALASGQIYVDGQLRNAVRFSDRMRCREACDRESCDRGGRYFLLSDDGSRLLLDETDAQPGGLGNSLVAGGISDLLTINNATYTVYWAQGYFLGREVSSTRPFAWLYGLNADECSYTLTKETRK